MHKHVQTFIQSAAEAFELRGPVYEFGHCPAGETADRPVAADGFPGIGHLGGETSEEAEIERLASLERLPYPDGSVRTIVCIDALNHLDKPARALEEMIRILAPSGMLLVCSPDEGAAATPDPGVLLTPQLLQQMLAPLEATLIGWQGPDASPHTLLAVGCKPPLPDSLFGGLNRFIGQLQTRLAPPVAPIGWRRYLPRPFAAWLSGRRPRSTTPDDQPHFLVHLPLDRHLKHLFLSGHLPDPHLGGRLDASG